MRGTTGRARLQVEALASSVCAPSSRSRRRQAVHRLRNALEWRCVPRELRFLNYGDPLRQAALELRFRVLREPLGFSRADVIVEGEQDSMLLVALDQGHVVACVMFTPHSPTRGQLRQMAVHPSHQGMGLGRALVRHLEQVVAAQGFEEIELHARDHAVGFYEKLGYAREGEPFIEVGISHLLMRKRC